MSWVGQPRPLPWHTQDDFGTAAIPAAIGGTREALWPAGAIPPSPGGRRHVLAAGGPCRYPTAIVPAGPRATDAVFEVRA
jgi:hypothetical protein